MSILKKTIFLVDDDITNLALGNDTLCQLYKVFTMNSGIRLLKMLETHTPDLILLDVEMPEMNGYETIRLLKDKEETKNIPVVFLTAQSDVESELKGLSLGAIDYIIKPFSPPLLIKRIEIHLLVESQKKQLVNFNNNLQLMVEERTQKVVELKNAFLRTIAELVECRDGSTGEHIGRTELYMSILLNMLSENNLYKEEVSKWDKNLILQSAQLHDVGKISIKDIVLQKPGKLTHEEFDEIKMHVEYGENVIDRIKKITTERAFLDQAKILIATHHEKWDGSGYPRGLKGKEIPLQGRMMAIADVYDALTSDRPYKKAFTHEEAVRIITNDKSKHFDPDLVDVFLSVSDKFKEISSLDYVEYIDELEDE
ncbi:MAG: response regulator [Treponema sp.]|jgi:putative two-component system response regulator|nr:response regulator [Treponema sp.]